jgi:hypothetical protein
MRRLGQSTCTRSMLLRWSPRPTYDRSSAGTLMVSNKAVMVTKLDWDYQLDNPLPGFSN